MLSPKLVRPLLVPNIDEQSVALEPDDSRRDAVYLEPICAL